MLNLPIDPVNAIGISPLLALLIYWLAKTITTKSSVNELGVSGYVARENSVSANTPSEAPPTDIQTDKSTNACRSSESSQDSADQSFGQTAAIGRDEQPVTVEAPGQQHVPQQQILQHDAQRICAKPPQVETNSQTKDQATKNASEKSSISAKPQQPKATIAQAEKPGTQASDNTQASDKKLKPGGSVTTAVPQTSVVTEQTNEDHYRSVAKSTNHATRDEVTTTISAHTFGLATELAAQRNEQTGKKPDNSNTLNRDHNAGTTNSEKNRQPNTHTINVSAKSVKNNKTSNAPVSSGIVNGNKQASDNQRGPEVANLAEVKLEKELARSANQQQASKDRPQSKIELAMARKFSEKSISKDPAKTPVKASTQTHKSHGESNKSLTTAPLGYSDHQSADTSATDTCDAAASSELEPAIATASTATTDQPATNTLIEVSAPAAKSTTGPVTTSEATTSPVAHVARSGRPTLLSKVRILDA